MSDALPISIDRDVTHAASAGRNGERLSSDQMVVVMTAVVSALESLGEKQRLVRAVKVSPHYPYVGSMTINLRFTAVISGPYSDECRENSRIEAKGGVTCSPEKPLDVQELHDALTGSIRNAVAQHIRDLDKMTGLWKSHGF